MAGTCLIGTPLGTPLAGTPLVGTPVSSPRGGNRILATDSLSTSQMLHPSSGGAPPNVQGLVRSSTVPNLPLHPQLRVPTAGVSMQGSLGTPLVGTPVIGTPLAGT